MAAVKRRSKPSYAGRVQWHPGMGRCQTTGKRSYPNRAKARRAQRIQGTGSVYRCEYCGSYHTTSYPTRIAAAIRYLLESIRDDQRIERLAKRARKIGATA